MGYGEEELLRGWYRETAENLERWLKGEELVRKMN
jgi:glycerate dehydrogenase